jgi:hypothetical protein
MCEVLIYDRHAKNERRFTKAVKDGRRRVRVCVCKGDVGITKETNAGKRTKKKKVAAPGRGVKARSVLKS